MKRTMPTFKERNDAMAAGVAHVEQMRRPKRYACFMCGRPVEKGSDNGAFFGDRAVCEHCEPAFCRRYIVKESQ